jgi:hypothetical protein
MPPTRARCERNFCQPRAGFSGRRLELSMSIASQIDKEVRPMTRFKIALAAVAVALVAVPTFALAAGEKSRADFERCNQQAMMAAGISDNGSPAASPSGTTGSGSSGSMTSPSTSGTSSTPSGSGTTGAGSGTSVSGSGSSTSGSGATSSGGVSGTGGPSGTGGVSGSTGVSGSASGSMSAGADAKIDRAVQAYRECLQR